MLRLQRLPFTVLALFAFCFADLGAQQPAAAQAPAEDYVRAHYTKYEFRIPMRDGKRLFTAVYVPKDENGGPYPFLMDRTPYSVAPYGEDQYPKSLGPSEEFQKSGYIFVYQDVRGRWMSEGEFIEMRPHIDNKKGPQDVDDASDTYDTIEFLLKHVPNNNGKVEVWVRNDGPGIPPEAKERIFERFYRVDRARSRESGGTGLGLSIVKHIVQAHSGEVWVKSEPANGTTFFFTLPVNVLA